MVGEPVVGDFVMHVVGIEERDQHVDVEQVDDAHGSSRSRFTSCIVGRAAPSDRGGRTGTPLRSVDGRVGAKPLRASSDSTFPAVLPCNSASSLAAARTSSSISRVVRIETSSHIRHLMSKYQWPGT